MAGKVRGMREAKANLDLLLKDITGRKAIRGIQSALLILGAASAKEVPRDTSTLLNSQFRDIDFKGTRITGRVGYSANYAVYVHEAPGKYLNTQTDRPVKRGETPGIQDLPYNGCGKTNDHADNADFNPSALITPIILRTPQKRGFSHLAALAG